MLISIIGVSSYLGVNVIVGNVGRAVLPVGADIVTKVFTGIGSAAIGMYLGDKTRAHVEKELNEMFGDLKRGPKKVKVKKTKKIKKESI